MTTPFDSCMSAIRTFDAKTSLDEYNFFDAHKLRPLPLEAEKTLNESWEHFGVIDNQEWCELRQYVSLEVAAKFLAYGLRMASLAIHLQSSEPIRWALMGLAIDNSQLDARDVFCVLCALNDASVEIGESLSEIKEKCGISVASCGITTALSQFLESPAYTRNLRSMGIAKVQQNDDIWYQAILR